MILSHGLDLVYQFQMLRLPMTVLVAEMSFPSPVLLIFAGVMFGHCVMSFQFLVHGFSLLVQMCHVHIITVY